MIIKKFEKNNNNAISGLSCFCIWILCNIQHVESLLVSIKKIY